MTDLGFCGRLLLLLGEASGEEPGHHVLGRLVELHDDEEEGPGEGTGSR